MNALAGALFASVGAALIVAATQMTDFRVSFVLGFFGGMFAVTGVLAVIRQ